jgi:hypothetical protein
MPEARATSFLYAKRVGAQQGLAWNLGGQASFSILCLQRAMLRAQDTWTAILWPGGLTLVCSAKGPNWVLPEQQDQK